ncbi:MAG: PIN domain-containing protein [Rhodospirillaceae bacterium]
MVIDRWTAFLDANVLYPPQCRNVLMELTVRGLYRAKWSSAVHDEWVRSVLRDRADVTEAELRRCVDLMNEHALDALVEGYEYLIPSIELPDPDDRHVVAAAIHSRCDVIVTNNLKDFPKEVMDRYRLKAELPDTFVTHMLDLHDGEVAAAIKDCRARLKKPPYTADEYLEKLSKQGLFNSVKLLRVYQELI